MKTLQITTQALNISMAAQQHTNCFAILASNQDNRVFLIKQIKQSQLVKFDMKYSLNYRGIVIMNLKNDVSVRCKSTRSKYLQCIGELTNILQATVTISTFRKNIHSET